MSPGLDQFLWSIGAAAGLSAVVLIIGRLVFDRSQSLGEGITAWTLSVGYLTGRWVLFGPPDCPYPPREGIHWLVWFMLVISLFGMVKRRLQSASWLHWILRGGGLLIAIILQFLSSTAHEWSPFQEVCWIAGLVMGGLFFWWTIEKLIERATSIESVMVWLMYSILIGPIGVLSGVIIVGQKATIMASCLAMLWIGTILGLRSINLKLLKPVVVIALMYPVQQTIFNNDMPFISAACLFAVPWACWAALGWLGNRKAWLRIVVLVTVVVFVCGIAAVWSITHMPEGSY